MEENTQDGSILADLESFYQNYLVESPNGFLQIFTSFTYGEMVISFLLLVLVMLFTFKWLWEALHYG